MGNFSKARDEKSEVPIVDAAKNFALLRNSNEKRDFKLIPYVSRADQEFVDAKSKTMWDNWDDVKPWDNDIAWDNVPWPSNKQRVDALKLNAIIQIRKEKGYGFVRNNSTGTIFYADKNAIELLESIKDKSLEEINKDFTDVIKELRIKY
ncbi:MAG: hypothetical protein M1465_03635 [Candidatus Marsarchaeota archaeon]|jgi:acyl-CoA-binding protein|nr:hypothetical protein [Candidatus Marsarchaeota archaeon]